MTLALGITGQMGTGKTWLVNAFASYLKQKDTPVKIVSVDEIRRRLMTTSPRHADLRAQVSKHFGLPLGAEGGFDLQKLAAAIFGLPQGREEFWAIAGTGILAAARGEMVGTGVRLLEWARLIEDGFLPLVDRVIVTSCSADTQRKRLDGGDLPPEQVQKRLLLQMKADDMAEALSIHGMKFRLFDTTACPAAEAYHRLCDEALHETA